VNAESAPLRDAKGADVLETIVPSSKKKQFGRVLVPGAGSALGPELSRRTYQMNRSRALLLLTIFFVVQVNTRADQVTLKNGDKVSGTVIKATLKPGLLEQWTGGADFGVALTKGNSDTTNLALGLALTRETLNDETNVYAASIYNRDNTNGVSRTVANTIRFGVRYDRNFNKRWFGYGFTDLERNGLQDLNLRWVLDLSDTGEYRVNFDTSLVTDVTKRIAWQLTLSDRYLSNPPPGLKQNDLLLTTGIRLKLGILK